MELTGVALSPHNDDVELFAAGQLCLYRPLVVVVFRSHVQELRGTGITSRQREAETDASMDVFGLDWRQWPYLDSAALPAEGEARIARLADNFDFCIAPAIEEGGHMQHNQVGLLAWSAFGPERTIRYTTYRRGAGRSSGETLVALDLDCEAAKAAALACYRTQIEEPTTASWFAKPWEEWLA